LALVFRHCHPPRIPKVKHLFFLPAKNSPGAVRSWSFTVRRKLWYLEPSINTIYLNAMKVLSHSRLVLGSFLSAVLLAVSVISGPLLADTKDVNIVIAKQVYTVNPEQTTVEAFAVSGGMIVATGSAQDLKAKYPTALITDHSEHTIVPGLIDAHGHFISLGQGEMRAELMGTVSKEDILSRLIAFEATLPKGQWLLGRGWDQNDWPTIELPTKADLDAAFPDRPVFLRRVDGHAAWANSAAMTVADRDLNGDWQVDGGDIVRDDKGEATGVFVDNAIGLVENKIPAPSVAEDREALSRSQNFMARVGLTGTHDAGTSLKVFKALQDMKAKGELNVRIYAMADGNADMFNYLCENGAVIDPDAMLTARSVKLYSDGALGSRGAALLAPYSDDPGNVGLLIETEEVLTQHAVRAAGCGLQVNIHAIGDRGNRNTINAIAAASKVENDLGRHRNEHSQVIDKSDFARFKALGIIASVQPTHATSDMYWAEDRVGAERIKGAYAWQTMAKMGIPLALGSDFPVERPHPIEGFYAAVTRQDSKAWPENGWYPAEALSREQALHGFTLGAAYAAFQEDQLGSIEVGKAADFTVFDQDIMQVPHNKILDTQIKATYVAGKAIFQQ